ncbi:MAG: tRNA lysidine(34) synthetase TilS [Chlamydiales bacterium]|nr:tRNA lysidine(34) synthetase TilS [Chlamydiales bacterium]
MFQEAFQLIKESIPMHASVIVGLSGAPDSTAHLLCIREIAKDYPLHIHAAHFDHAYRKESGDELLQLKEFCNSLQISFYSDRLKGPIPSRNIEDVLREKRYRFFASIYQEVKAEAIFLGHHKDDQVETVLKRIFEGSSLPHLKGMQYETFHLNMRILRPFLCYTKQKLLGFLHASSTPYFIDQSNEDTRFLRSRLRLKMLPFIEECFGKDITNNIVKLSGRAQEIDEYLGEQIKQYTPYWQKATFGGYIDFSAFYPLKKVEIIYFLQKVASFYQTNLGMQQLETIYELLSRKALNKSVLCSHLSWIVDRNILFCIKELNFTFKKLIHPLTPVHWKEIWEKEEFVVHLPSDSYEWKVVDLKTICANGYKLQDWYSNHKVPIFLRKIIPVVVKDDVVYQDLLTGKPINNRKI